MLRSTRRRRRATIALRHARAEIARLRAAATAAANETLRLKAELTETCDVISSRPQPPPAEGALSLHVASRRLLESIERRDVLQAIHEIVTNLIGSEELIVFAFDEGGRALVPISAVGVLPSRYAQVPVGEGIIGAVAESGIAHVSRDPADAEPTACVPLLRRGGIIGVLAIFRLLRQKTEIAPHDHDILELLSSYAGTALCCSHEGWAA